MLGRTRDADRTTASATGGGPNARAAVFGARGGVSLGAILTGVVVASGAMFIISALILGVMLAVGLIEDIGEGENIGLGAGIGLVLAQLLAYLWGGYTAGRMARGAGAANGLLVALAAVIIAVAVGGIAIALGTAEQLNLPFDSTRLPLGEQAAEQGVGVGIAALVAMFLGALIGGVTGARWHSKLEERALDEEAGAAPGDRTIDVRNSAPAPARAGTPPPPATSSRSEPPSKP